MPDQPSSRWVVVYRDRYDQRHNNDGGNCKGQAERGWPPVEVVNMKKLRNPQQCNAVVEAIVYDEKEPEVQSDKWFPMARRALVRILRKADPSWIW